MIHIQHFRKTPYYNVILIKYDFYQHSPTNVIFQYLTHAPVHPYLIYFIWIPALKPFGSLEAITFGPWNKCNVLSLFRVLLLIVLPIELPVNMDVVYYKTTRHSCCCLCVVFLLRQVCADEYLINNVIWISELHDDVIKWKKKIRVTGPLCREFTGDRLIPRTQASDAELWCFLWSALE